MSVLGLDLGGTNIKSVVVTPEKYGLQIGDFDTFPTEADGGPEVVIERIVELGRSMIERHGPVERMGLGVPGLFSRDTGTIELFPNLPGEWKARPSAAVWPTGSVCR